MIAYQAVRLPSKPLESYGHKQLQWYDGEYAGHEEMVARVWKEWARGGRINEVERRSSTHGIPNCEKGVFSDYDQGPMEHEPSGCVELTYTLSCKGQSG